VREEIIHIVELLLEDVTNRLKDRGISIVVSDAAKQFISEAGYDPVYGARPLKRFIQRELETRVGRALIADELQVGGSITVDASDGNGLVVKTSVKKEQAA
jgi:ATP-dependent Clp protease ATP-binding subunit ClpB